MKKRVHAIVLVIAMIFSMLGNTLFNVVNVSAAGTVTVKFHYTRENGDYTGWNLWTWSDKNQPLKFTENEANGVCATGTYSASTKEVGYIVRYSDETNEWAQKDVDANRFVDLSIVMGGTVNVYIKQGEEEAEVNYDEANIAKGDIITKASVDASALDTINFELREPVKGDKLTTGFTVESKTGTKLNVVSTTLNSDKKSGVIKLQNPIFLLAKYVIKESNGIEVDITTPDYYTTDDFVNKYTYKGDDLGAVVDGTKTTFKLWAPTAHSARVVFFNSSSDKTTDVKSKEFMTLGQEGVWTLEVPSNLNGSYYMYEVQTPEGKVMAGDPYAKSAGVNGVKSMVIDLTTTNPSGWDNDKHKFQKNITDASIYELHVRDFSSHEDSGITNKGKYLAFTEKGTKTSKGNKSGIDYLSDLGINYVHILPTYDYGSVDENTCKGYNWGYDPVNYNVPEGSYSTDPSDGAKRVTEYKQMVKALHDENIGVIMDVVYNHVYNTDEFSYNKIMNGYFSRPDSNASGCGNDTATEREMVKKYIVDSVKYWATEYHIDGFRFDLMGLIDVDTMNAVRAALNEINPKIIVYGEGWSMDTKTVKEVELATQKNSDKTEGIAYFNDTIRDAIKGSSQEGNESSKGFVNGGISTENKDAIKAAVKGRTEWANTPSQIINYASCHDNYTLWDKLCQSNPDATDADRVKMNKMSAAIVYTSQGVPFIMQGEELLRSKKNSDGKYNGNSYNAPDAVNAIDYNKAAENRDVFDYYKGLIQLRKEHAAFRMATFNDTSDYIEEIKDVPENVVAFEIKKAKKEIAKAITIIYNADTTEQTVNLPEGSWKVCVNGEKAGTEILEKVKGSIKVSPLSCYVLINGKVSAADTSGSGAVTHKKTPAEIDTERNSVDEALLLMVLLIIGALALISGIAIYSSVFKGKLYSDEELEYLEMKKKEETEAQHREEIIIEEEAQVIDSTLDFEGPSMEEIIENRRQDRQIQNLSDLLQLNDFTFDSDSDIE